MIEQKEQAANGENVESERATREALKTKVYENLNDAEKVVSQAMEESVSAFFDKNGVNGFGKKFVELLCDMPSKESEVPLKSHFAMNVGALKSVCARVASSNLGMGFFLGLSVASFVSSFHGVAPYWIGFLCLLGVVPFFFKMQAVSDILIGKSTEELRDLSNAYARYAEFKMLKAATDELSNLAEDFDKMAESEEQDEKKAA